jgi:anti-sigma B factor antagonist
MGLGVFASALKKLKKSNGDLKLINLSPTVMELLERSRLDKVFDVFETEEEAVKSFVEHALNFEITGASQVFALSAIR